MLIKIHYSNCEDEEGALELHIIEDSSLKSPEFKDKVEKLLSDYAEENIFMTSVHFFVDMLATHGIVAEELSYDIEIY